MQVHFSEFCMNFIEGFFSKITKLKHASFRDAYEFSDGFDVSSARQLADRTESSISSMRRQSLSIISSRSRSESERLSSNRRLCERIRANTSRCLIAICEAKDTASTGVTRPSVVTSRTSRSKSVSCPTRVFST